MSEQALATTRADRRGLVLAVAGCVAAAAALLLGAGQVWLRVGLPARAPLPAVSQTFTGGEVADALVPLGILVGAAGLALIAARKVGRLIVGVVVLAAGLLSAAAVGFFLYDDGDNAATSWAQGYAVSAESLVPQRDLFRLPALLALAGGGVAVAVGIFVIVRGRRWPVMGARYERRPGAASAAGDGRARAGSTDGPRGAQQPVSETAMWAALERGEDPTAPSSPARPSEANPASATRDKPGSGG